MEVNIHYSPQQLDQETLIRLFVNREAQLKFILARIVEARNSGALAHTFIVGPRGSGKTYLVLMAYYQAMKSDDFGKRYLLSLLPEDSFEITSYETLMDMIDKNREPLNMDDSNEDIVTIAFIENFDHILNDLGIDGQRRLRAYIERNQNLLLVTTAQRLSPNSFEHTMPFYGFFDTVNLSAFNTEEITSMLIRQAEVNGNIGLVTKLTEPDTQAHLAALVQEIGGWPRIWSFFSFGLTNANLEGMVSLMLERLDLLTPQYQEMIKQLSTNERKAVMTLINSDGAMTVKMLAGKTGIEQKSLSTTLRLLPAGWIIPRDGYLMQYVDKRNTYYQLAEPIFRVVSQIKRAKGKSVKSVVDFLAAWFAIYELEKSLFVKSGRYSQPFFDREQHVTKARMLDFAAIYINEEKTTMPSSSNSIYEYLLKNSSYNDFEEKHPIKSDETLVHECFVVEDALSTLQNTRSAEKILSLPISIANTIEERLKTTSCALIRLEIAFLAVRFGGPSECLQWALAAILAGKKEDELSLRPDEEKTAQLMIACIRLLLGQDQAGLQTLDFALSLGEHELTDKQCGIIASTVDCPTHTLCFTVMAELLSLSASHFPESKLSDMVEF